MKHYLITFTLGMTIVFAKTFTITDPPMVYIYHFVSYDTTDVVFHGGIQDESQNKKLRFPLFNKLDISIGDEIVMGKPLDPKLVSAMVTTAVANNPFVRIAGESIQTRMKTDNFIKLIKSYDYPKRTDFIFIGEINTLASQYEIDLKLIDVSTQNIVSSESFNLPFTSLGNLRQMVNSVVEPVIQKIVSPFLGYAYVRVDSTSRDKVRWNDISIRPLKSMVGAEIKSTTDEDFVPFQTGAIPNSFLSTHDKILLPFNPIDVNLVLAFDGTSVFLAGDYRFKGFLKNNEEPFETNFTVLPGNLNEIHMSLPYTPPPKDTDGDGIIDDKDACPEVPGVANEDLSEHGCPLPEKFGNIIIANLWDGVGVEVTFVTDNGDELIITANNDQNNIIVDAEPYRVDINKKNSSITIFNLPLGIYARNSFAMTEEMFPGKHYVNIFSDSDTLMLNQAGMDLRTNIANKNNMSGKEIVIYFDPFTPNEDDEYRFYLGESMTPFTVVSVAGELHIVGFPTGYDGEILVEREGFLDAIVKINKGTKKGYYLANLNVSETEENSEEVGFNKFMKFK
jgi:hypothetical protein